MVPVAPQRPRWLEGFAVLACVGLALWIQRHALEGFFGPDDFVVLERARGLLPRPHSLWRILFEGYVAGAFRAFGTVPRPYLVAAWLLHGANVVLLYAWARRAGGGALAATVAAGLFGVSRLHFTTLGQVATGGELLSAGLLLAALLAWGWRGWTGTAFSAVLFLAALLAKENVALVPLILLLPGPAGDPWRSRLGRSAPLLALGVLWWLYLISSGVRTSVLGGAAYATGTGVNLFHNLMTYAEWTVDLDRPVPDLFGTYSGVAWVTGGWLYAGLGAAAWLARRRHPLPALGAAWWLLGLLPVIPLLYHSYLHYLYLPSAGLALALGGTLEWAVLGLSTRGRGGAGRTSRGARVHAAPGPGWGWLPAVALVLGYALVSSGLIAVRLRERLPTLDLPIDPFLRKTELARRTAEGTAGAVRAGIRRVAFLVPEGPAGAYHDLIRATLDQGRGLRFLQPGLDSVAYVTRWSPAHGEFELFAQDPDGRTRRLGRGPEALLEWSALLARDGSADQACAALDSALVAWPADTRLARARRQLASRLLTASRAAAARTAPAGDSASARPPFGPSPRAGGPGRPGRSRPE